MGRPALSGLSRLGQGSGVKCCPGRWRLRIDVYESKNGFNAYGRLVLHARMRFFNRRGTKALCLFLETTDGLVVDECDFIIQKSGIVPRYLAERFFVLLLIWHCL